MNRLTDAIVKAQSLLKDRADLVEVLAVIGKFANQTSDTDLSPEVEAALATIDTIYKAKTS